MSSPNRYPQKLKALPYPGRDGVLALFAPFADLLGAVLLDSAGSAEGRYDIFSALPEVLLTTHGEQTLVHTSNAVKSLTDDPFELMQQQLDFYRPMFHEQAELLPFNGGLIAALAYDLGRRIETLPNIAEHDLPIPELYAGIYQWACVIDHEKKTAAVWQFGQMSLSTSNFVINAFLHSKAHSPFELRSPWQSNLSREQYGAAFRRVQEYIRAGDCYQINLAQRFQAETEGHPFDAYKRLRQHNRAPYSAYLNGGKFQLLSVSPERFIEVENRRAKTEPIKGTRPRAMNPEQDEANAEALRNSEKDRAENVMIVDLLRNDFGKHCKIGSVKVPELFAIRRFPAVHHMVSTVTGELPDNVSPLQLLRDCFPGGSITGAPKVRAMEIIDELEPQRRSYYCGSLMYGDYRGRMDSSILIRTLVHHEQQLYCWAGGGLVADSDEQAEYDETLAKVSRVLPVLESRHN